MRVRDLIPFGEDRPVPRDLQSPLPSLHGLQREVNRIFDEVWRDFGLGRPWSSNGGYRVAAPRVDVSEDDDEVRVTAELPGLDEKDVNVTFADGVLTIRGEKKAESEEKGRRYYLAERAYGAFQRTLPIDNAIDADKVSAEFKNGVLTISLPKTKEARKKVRQIPIRAH